MGNIFTWNKIKSFVIPICQKFLGETEKKNSIDLFVSYTQTEFHKF